MAPKYFNEIFFPFCVGVSCDSAVGKSTRYRLGGPGIESRLGVRFSAPVQSSCGSYQASYTLGAEPFPGVRRRGRGVNHPPPSTAEVEERVEL